MKSIRIAIVSTVVIAALGGCSKKESDIVVSRGDYNQPAITVRSAPPGKADELLMEKQGYVEAQDRFLQMDILRRLSQGRLSEIFGTSAVDRDTQMIATGLPLSAKRSLEKLKSRFPESVVLLNAFARGVNQWIREQVDQNTEMARSYQRWTNNPRYQIDLWMPVDSVAVAESVAFYLSSDISQRILIGKIAAAYLPDVEKATDLLDLRAIEKTFILDANRLESVQKSAELSQNDGNQRTANATKTRKPLPLLAQKAAKAFQKVSAASNCQDRQYPFPPCFRQPSYGSNNWVVSRQAAGGKQAFVANDPHLQLSFPSNFIEVALDSTPAGGTFKVRGVNLPGIPGILIGHNGRIAWALTNDPADVDDVYIEMVNADGTHVTFGESQVAIETVNHVLKIRQLNGELAEKVLPLRMVPHHGPVVSDHFPEVKPALAKLEAALESKIGISYKWTGHAGSTEVAAILGVNRAQNFDEFKQSLQAFEVGAQNIIYADVDGNIGYYSHANFPIRHYLKDLLPGVPVFGWLGQDFEWDPKWREVVPELYNPSTGRIVTANNDPFGTTANEKFYTSDYFGMGFDIGARAQRITELLDAKRGNLTLEDMKRIQYDHKDLFALRVIGLVGKVGARLTLTPDAKAVYDELVSYDGLALRERRTPVVVDTFVQALAREHFKPLKEQLAKPEEGEAEASVKEKEEDAAKTVDELIQSMLGVKTVYHKVSALISAEPVADSTIQLITNALEQSSRELKGKSQRWGQENKVNFYSPLVGIFPSLISAPIERNGSFATVDVAESILGPNFRLIMVLEEGKPIEGINAIAGGNYSPFSGKEWLRELMLWSEGKYRDLVPFAR